MLGSAPGVMAVLLRTISSKVGVGWVTTIMEKVKAMMLAWVDLGAMFIVPPVVLMVDIYA